MNEINETREIKIIFSSFNSNEYNLEQFIYRNISSNLPKIQDEFLEFVNSTITENKDLSFGVFDCDDNLISGARATLI